MNMFNRFYRFGSVVKPKASLYCLGIVFFISITNLCFDITTIHILTLLQTFVVSMVIALIEYFSFNNYDELSKEKKKTNTIIWAILTNIIIVSSSIIFKWFPTLPLWTIIVLFIILEISIISMRYSIYIINLADTKDLNSKLQKYQQDTLK
ncbi:hypothetical protein [Inediibacterium massiliense]|uniref:hypothetical protein n=1 Tax=Inediibacterium massiliense TaxID=1658111 RepID=UPI0006B51C49|nr:hypothetical protein [Inediibacterium massiliense]